MSIDENQFLSLVIHLRHYLDRPDVTFIQDVILWRKSAARKNLESLKRNLAVLSDVFIQLNGNNIQLFFWRCSKYHMIYAN